MIGKASARLLLPKGNVPKLSQLLSSVTGSKVAGDSFGDSLIACNGQTWLQPEGRDTGLSIYNSATRSKCPLILPKSGILKW